MKNQKKSDSILGVDIKHVQKTELEILLEFDRICKNNGIKYQLFAGTLLGAIRHEGFIPWDDDIDVCMLRSEYNKFMKVVREELHEDYFFQTYETNPNYINRFAKIRKNNTVFMEKLVEGMDMHHGVYMDIFALDNVKPDTKEGNKQIKQLRRIDSFFKFRNKRRYEIMEAGFERLKARNKYKFIKALPFSKMKVDNFALDIMTRFNNEDTEYVADLGNPGEMALKAFTIKKGILSDSILWTFEGHQFPIPRAYDSVLTNAYGHCMTLPDKENQVSHHDIVQIDLGLENTKIE